MTDESKLRPLSEIGPTESEDAALAREQALADASNSTRYLRLSNGGIRQIDPNPNSGHVRAMKERHGQ